MADNTNDSSNVVVSGETRIITDSVVGLSVENGGSVLNFGNVSTRKSHRWSNFGSFSGCSGL
ncbi:hypothetical protein, partial [Acetobacter pomorum]